MMNFTLKHLERMKRLHQLLLRKRTGTPKDCAQKLKISDRTLREDIQIIKEWGVRCAMIAKPLAIIKPTNSIYGLVMKSPSLPQKEHEELPEGD